MPETQEIKFNANLIYLWETAISPERLQVYAPLIADLASGEIKTIAIRDATVQCRARDMMPLLIDLQDYSAKTGIDIKKDNREQLVEKLLNYLKG